MAFTTDDTRNIDRVEFGVLSPEQIVGMSVGALTSSKLDGPGMTVYDKSMGCVTDNNESCITCNRKKGCWGHFAHIVLAEPVLHPLLIVTDTGLPSIVNFLKVFCRNAECTRPMINELQMESLSKCTGKQKFARILDQIDGIGMCPHCFSPLPKVTYRKRDSAIVLEYKKKGAKNEKDDKVGIILEASEIRDIFDNISDDNVRLTGLDPKLIHPRNLVMTMFPVIPPCSRPYVIADGGEMCDDDLTTQTIEIMKVNTALQDPKLTEQKRTRLYQTLVFRIETTFKNDLGKSKHPTDNRPTKCITSRLKGKGGQFRKNKMGCRCDFTARSVIGADPSLELDEVGVPYEMCKVLTKEERVTVYNIEYMTILVNNDQANFVTRGDGSGLRFNLKYSRYQRGTELLYGDIIVRTGIKIVEKDGVVVIPTIDGKNVYKVNELQCNIANGDRIIRDGKLISVVYPKKKYIKLNIGDTVERHLRKGDIILFNRQPSLHKNSAVAMRVVPMKHKTLRMNLAGTKGFNADFDGDEMNIHLTQDYESEMEFRMLVSISKNIIGAQSSTPIVCIVQNTLIAAYKATKANKTIGRYKFMNISMNGSYRNGDPLWSPAKISRIAKVLLQFKKKPEVFNGRGLFSLILPDNLYFEYTNDASPEEPTVKIYSGVLYEGIIDKKILGGGNSLIRYMHATFGSVVTTDFVNNVQFVMNEWLRTGGFSVGLEDCMVASGKCESAIRDTLAEAYIKVKAIEDVTHNPGIREIRVKAALDASKSIGMRIADTEMKPDNNFGESVRSGAKGDKFNIAQLTGLLGQQNVSGGRIKPVISNGRTLPHYPIGELDPETRYESRGFIRHSFIRGLSPQEAYFHAMSGREGICDTAMGTASTGYTQRRLIKLCENLKVEQDGTVRDSQDKVFQLVYGENGYDPCRTVNVGGDQQVCDISRMATMLNSEYVKKTVSLDREKFISDLETMDKKVSDCNSTAVEFCASHGIEFKTQNDATNAMYRYYTVDTEKENLISRIMKLNPSSVIDATWDKQSLRDRLSVLGDIVNERTELIAQITDANPTTVIDESWDVEALRQRLEGLSVDSDSSQESDSDSELMDSDSELEEKIQVPDSDDDSDSDELSDDEFEDECEFSESE